MQILEFDTGHASSIASLVHDAVSKIDHKLYSKEQLFAWSKAPRSARHWFIELKKSQAWVLVDDEGSVIGLINCTTRFTERGYIEHLYIASEYQGKGYGTCLYQHLERWALTKGYPELSTHASKLSKPMFEKLGFSLVAKVYQQKSAQSILGYEMRKPLLARPT